MAITEYLTDTVHLRDTDAEVVAGAGGLSESINDTVHLRDSIVKAIDSVSTYTEYLTDEVHLRDVESHLLGGGGVLTKSINDTVHLRDTLSRDVVVATIMKYINDFVHLRDEFEHTVVASIFFYQNENVSFGDTKDVGYKEYSHRFRWTNYNGIAVPDLNYKDLKEPITRIIPAPSFLQFKYDNSFIIFTRNTINRFVLEADVATGQWRSLTDNLIEEQKDIGLMDHRTLVLAGATLFGLSEKGVWKWNKDGFDLISKDILNIDDIGDDDYMAFYNSVRNQYILHKQTLAIGDTLYELEKGAILTSAEDAYGVDVQKIGDNKVVSVGNVGSSTYDDDHLIASTIDKSTLTSVEGAAVTQGSVRRGTSSLLEWGDDKFIYAYRESGDQYVVVGTVSGTTITLQTPVSTAQSFNHLSEMVRLNDTQFVLLTANLTNCTYQIGTVSGNSISLGAIQTVTAVQTTGIKAVQLESNKIILHYAETAVGNKYVVGTYSGGEALNFGSVADPGIITNSSDVDMEFLTSQRVVCVQWIGNYGSPPPPDASTLGVYPLSIDGDTITVGNVERIFSVGNPSSRILSDGTGTGFLLFYRDNDNSDYLTVVYAYTSDTDVTLIDYTTEVITDYGVGYTDGIDFGDGYVFIKWSKAAGNRGYQQVWGRIINQTESYAYHIDKDKWTIFEGLNILDVPITLSGGSLDENYNVWINSDIQLQQYPGTSYCLHDTKIETKNFYIKKGVFQRWILDFEGSSANVTTRVNRVVNDVETQVEDYKAGVVPNEERWITLSKSRGRTMSIVIEGANIIRSILFDLKMWGEK